MFTSVRRLGTAVLTTVPIVAMSMALAVPASADSNAEPTVNASSSQPLVHTITTVTADPSKPKENDEVTYLATVQPVSGKAFPGGTVLFTVSSKSTPVGTRLCTAYIPLNGIGNAKCISTRAPVGTDTVTATYSGDAAFEASADTTNETVSERNPAPVPDSWNHVGNQQQPSSETVRTTTAVTVPTNPPSEGDQVKYTATVHPASGTVVPTGTVTFTAGSTPLCNNPITLDAGGQAECKSSKTPLGTSTVTAAYSGALTFSASSGTTTETVSARAAALSTTTTVTADRPTSTLGDPVTYTATVHPPSGKTAPIGSVSFSVGTTKLCTAVVALNGVGNAKCVSPRAPVGTDTVTATYQPADAGFTPSTGTATETVTNTKTYSAPVKSPTPAPMGSSR